MEYTYNKIVNPYNLEYDLNRNELPKPYNITCNFTQNVTNIYFDNSLTLEQVTILESVVQNHVYSEVDLEIDELKIYDYIQNTKKMDKMEPPKGHNYVTGLTLSLFPKRYFSHGELQKVEWYSDIDLTDIVIRADVVYTRNPLGFATSRTTTRTWFKKSGEEHPDKKITIKDYTINRISQMTEGIRRRKNIIDSIQQPILDFMLQTIGPEVNESESDRQSRVLETGRQFIIDHMSTLISYAECSDRTFVESLVNYTNEYDWLNNTIDESNTTIRDFIISEMNI